MNRFQKRGLTMGNSARYKGLSFLLGALLLAPALALTTAATASAGVAGPKILTAAGGVTDSHGDTGQIVMGGLVVLNNKGGAKSLNLTIAFQDNPVVSTVSVDSFVCTVTDPADFSYSITKGVGTATLTLSSSDKCVQTLTPSNTFSNAGKSISFQVYALGSKLRMVSTGSTLVDGVDDPLVDVAVSGGMDPAGAGSPQAGGVRVVAGGGGAVDVDDTYSGHMALAGLIALNRVTKKVTNGSARSLDLALTWEDTDSGNLSCQFTDAKDVAYTLNKGVGRLTLTVGPSDTCSVANAGNSISFDLYVGGASGRIVSTGSTIVDSKGNTLIPAAVATFSTAGGF